MFTLGLITNTVNAQEIVQSPLIMDNSFLFYKAAGKSIFLAIVIWLIWYWWKRTILPQVRGRAPQNLKVVERLYLDPSTCVYLVECAGRHHLITSSNKNLQVVHTYKKGELKIAPPIEVLPLKTPDFKDIWQKYIMEAKNSINKKKKGNK